MKKTVSGNAAFGAILLLALVVAAVRPWRSIPPSPAHVIIISVDTLRRDHVTAYGYSRDTTPRIESLAASGVVFDEAFAARRHPQDMARLYQTGHTSPPVGFVGLKGPARPTIGQSLTENLP